MLKTGLGITLKEEVIGGHVKDRNDFLRIANHLRIQLWTVMQQMTAIHIEEGLLEGVDLHNNNNNNNNNRKMLN